tara:strand:+ start:8748 stop:9341 length:594 start_codon:yes stop_codon:yes gene_type:complete
VRRAVKAVVQQFAVYKGLRTKRHRASPSRPKVGVCCSIKKEFYNEHVLFDRNCRNGNIFLYTGIKVIVAKKPLLIASKIFMVIMLFALLPKVILIFEYQLSSPGDLGLIAYISPLMTFVLLAFCWIQLKGYIAIGISDESFRHSLHYALHKNSIEFEEQLSLIKLKDMKADLQVSVQSWMGTGQLKLKNGKSITTGK